MNSRRFLIYALAYTAVVALVVYSLFPNDATVGVFDYSFTLPVAVWVAIAVGVLGIFALVHMLYHSFLVYKFKRSIKKDGQIYKDLARAVLLASPFSKKFHTDNFELAASVTSYLSPYKDELKAAIKDDELSQIADIIELVNSGEVADLKRFRLAKENPLSLKNEINKVNKLKEHYLDVLKNKESYDERVSNAAYKKLILQGDYANIKKYSLSVRSTDDELIIIKRFADKDISLSADEVFEIINDDRFSQAQFIKLASMLSKSLEPDAYLNIFAKLRAAHAQADSAYLYVLFELSMIDEAREILQNSASDEFSEFKALLFLRDNSKIVPTCLFFK